VPITTDGYPSGLKILHILMTDNHINIRPKHQYLDGSRFKADPFTRGACAEASAGAITYI